ncbi:NFX1-type zinc finger-containing protein 1-like [Babylonia areolata]|uniref:NFX1-type zinc finger-containing protein 1-like n=1 Tax=Babylonia areolata TaxID=304850 RepID=UPI003FD1AAD8
MWNSSDDSDTPHTPAAPQKAGQGLPQEDSKSKKSPNSTTTKTIRSLSSSQTQLTFCGGKSSSSADSDSSSGGGSGKARYGSVKAVLTAPAQQTPKPKHKPDQNSKAERKPDPKPEWKAFPQNTGTLAWRNQLVSGKENRLGRTSTTQPDLHPQAQQAAQAREPSADASVDRPAEDLSSFDYSALDFPSLGSTLSSKENASSKPMYNKKSSTTPKDGSSGGNQGRTGSFEKHQPNPSGMNKGKTFSKREEKLCLNDFMPKTKHDKKKKKNRNRQGEVFVGSESHKEGCSSFDSLQSGGGSMNLQSGTKAGRGASSLQAPRQSCPPPPPAAAAKQGHKETAGGTRHQSGAARKPRNEDSSETDDSDDENLLAFLPSRPDFIPPENPPVQQGGETEPSSSGDAPPGVQPAVGSGAVEEEETIPKQVVGDWPRGQRLPGQGSFRRRDEGHRWDRNRRDQGSDNSQDRRPHWRDNQPNRNPRNNNNNNNNNNNRRENQNNRNFPNENVRQEGGGGGVGRPPQRPQQERWRGRAGQAPHADRPAGNRQQQQQQQQQQPPPPRLRPLEANLSFTRLRELKGKPPAEVVAALTYSKEGLSRLLNNNTRLSAEPDSLRFLLSALAKTCECGSMPAQRGGILNQVRTSPYLHALGTYLTTYSLTSQVTDLISVIGESADLLKTMLNMFPSSLHDVVMAHAFLDMAVKTAKVRGGGDLPPEVTQKLDELNIDRDAAVEGLAEKESKKSRKTVDEDSQTPPDDFRLISVFPTMDDLSKEELPFLRKNKVKGGYRSTDHYLDVQFRLLREDFVYPLREGIAQYLQMIAAPRSGHRLKDIRMYHDVHILRAVCLQSGLGHRLTFDVSRMKRVRWEISKRLIFGSLVCLSADNFQTLFFATVANREASDLREGVVEVIFEHDIQEVAAIPPETTFMMAETTAFFEAYRHVLAGLQNMVEGQMPFERYIVSCEKTVSEPRYLRDNGHSEAVKYDLRPLVDDDVVLREDRNLLEQGREVAYDFSREAEAAHNVPILQREEWPDPSLLRLDDSQFEAVHRALTKEFSVIQGPPGTGKTYVGLKVVKALLHNRPVWDPTSSSCMLIVCFTNHALDQFLSGVVSFFKGTVVRVGSRLRSEELEPYTLNNLRRTMRRNREGADRAFANITRLRFQGHDAMERLKDNIDSMGLKIESAKREILHEELLMPYMLDRHYDRLLDGRRYMEEHAQLYVRQGRPKKIFSIPEWLGIGALLQNIPMTVENLHQLEQELEGGAGEGEDMELEGEVQALEEQHRLDSDDVVPGNDRQRRQKEKKSALAKQRSTYLALDISRLDQGVNDLPPPLQGGVMGEGFQVPRSQWRKIKRRLRKNLEAGDRMTAEEERQVHDLWQLEFPQRWRLYRRWTFNLCQALKEEMGENEQLYVELARRHHETLMQEDKHILKTATVIAMTTTAAARYQSVLQEVKPKVIVVEEAAEVLEGHVITTLSQGCEQLILIGDHKQLRPNPTVYTLAQKYHLELSLFERMINNGLRCVTLGLQHRMRPEIAKLVRPIYPALANHPSVEGYEAVKGVASNLFFINHGELEAHNEETKSHSNEYEAFFVTMLCQYLLKQGYHPSRITVLTTYSGQLFQLRKLMPKKSIFDGVRVTVVDNFQGEENDIILLSLVRSNEERNIGFLKIENRVCVALSRAKMGLYVIGNFNLLSSESSLWQRITTDLDRAGKLGESLALYCQNHPQDRGLVVRKPEDFNFAPEGGCMKSCDARLDCGHVCVRMCHPYDKDHIEYKCTKECGRKMDCEFGHTCRKQCYKECGDCTQLVERRMPKCGHTQWMPCSFPVREYCCQEACEVVLLCGHPCGDVCGQRHKCYEKVEHTWPCGHTGVVPCAERDTAPCRRPCDETLACGHKCTGTCYECRGGRLHKQCGSHCPRILVCGHSCRDACSNCPPCTHSCENSCVHSSCRKKCSMPCPPCNEPCQWRCPHHRCSKLCHEPCDRPRCDEPCPYRLQCGHPCIGLCGEPCPRLCRFCHAVQVTEIFFGTEDEPNARFVELSDCGHVFEVSGLDQWMVTTASGTSPAPAGRGGEEDSVHLKACPACRTPIRRSLRYGAIIKAQLRDIEAVKEKMQGRRDERLDKRSNIQALIVGENDPVYVRMKEAIVEQGDEDSLVGLVAMVNQMTFLEQTKQLRLLQKKKGVHGKGLSLALDDFEKWLCQSRRIFSDQESSDGQTETKRLSQWLALQAFTQMAADRGTQLPPRVLDPANNLLRRMQDGRIHSEDHQRMTSDILTQLADLVPESGLRISDTERVMIVKAMGLGQGHWFKCPEGHVYAIADCGGATVESRCPDCRAVIGGTGHRVAEDNDLAREMDGATGPAWPTALDRRERRGGANNNNNGGGDVHLRDLF